MNDKDNKKTIKQISNPFSTGGGGASFENLVGAFYVSQLLSNKLIYGHLEAGTVKEIAFQNRWRGIDVDDLIIYGNAEINSEKSEVTIKPKLILQVKNRLNFRLSDAKFTTLIEECWQTFNNSFFNFGYDRIGIMLNNIDSKVRDHFIRLLNWARTSNNSSEFLSKVNTPKYGSQAMREYYNLINTILSDPAEDDLWKFLKHLKILELELTSMDSKDYLESIENLRSVVINQDPQKAIVLLTYILERCTYYNKNGGRISLNTLYQDITISTLLEKRNIKNYWEKNWGSNISLEFLRNLGNLSNELGEIREDFKQRLFILEKKRTQEIQAQIDNLNKLLTENQSEDLLNSQKVLGFQLASIKEICVLSIFNQLSERLLEFFKKGFTLSLRIQESCRFVSPSIYKAIGRETAIPYIESEFFSHKVRITLERYFENYPDFRESITHFYHGFIEGLADSQFFDSNVLHTIENCLGFLYHLGYKPIGRKEDIHFYDLTNHFILNLCQKLSVNSPRDLGQPTSSYTTVFRRILDFVTQQTVRFKTENPLVIDVKLYILGELFRLPIPFKLRTPILKDFINVLNNLIKEMHKSSTYHVYFFAILQKIWVQILHPSHEINSKTYQNFLSELMKFYEVIISIRIKTENNLISHPFINQMNRTYIDLLYYLIKIFKELEIEETLLDIFNLLNDKLIKIGDKLFRTYPEKEYYKWLLEPLAIIRFLMVNSKTQEESVILSKGNIFDSLCSIGTMILMVSQGDKISEKEVKFKSEIQKIVAKTYPLDENFNCIEYRQGNWDVFGLLIGNNILQFHNAFTDPNPVYQVLNSLSFFEKL